MAYDVVSRRAFLKSVVAEACALSSTAVLCHRRMALAQMAPECLDDLIEPIRRAHEVPALAGAFVLGRELLGLGVMGVRRARTTERVQSTDRFHIGSNTKSMTATLIAVLVEQGRLSWDTGLAEIFPDLRSRIHPGFQRVTLLQLLSHRAGLPEDRAPDPVTWPQVLALSGSLPQQRRALMELVLARSPVYESGTRMQYSNFGYVIAGAVAEQVTGQAWEESMQRMLFGPLGMASAGFGAPGLAQPWGHTPDSCQPVQPGPEADNPAVIGPAGTVHCAMNDWALYASLHLRGARGESNLLLKPESFQQLHRDGYQQGYALGWGVVRTDWAGGPALFHTGSNGLWIAVIVVIPARNGALLAATNCGADNGSRACDAVVGAMIRKYVS